MIEIIRLFIHSFWGVLGQMAPYLIFGYLIAGILSVFVTPETVQKHLGGSKFASTLKAALFGMPLPLCSCSVIPVTASLRKSGAGRGAIASFLISTPTTGVDSIMAAWALMGPVFAVYRAIMSVILGVVAGVLVNIFGESDTLKKDVEEGLIKDCGDCCSHEHVHSAAAADKPSMLARAMQYGFITIPKDLGKSLFIGILVASIISALIEGNFIDQFLGAGLGTMVLMLVVGIPLYVCATASIPLALGFMALGASPGAAFVFLIAGPATNAATIVVLWKMIGKRSTIIMLGCMFFGALLGGMLLDACWGSIGSSLAEAGGHAPEHSGNWFYSLSAVALILIQLWSMYGGRVKSKISGANTSCNDSCCCGAKSEFSAAACCSSKEVKSSSGCAHNESSDNDCISAQRGTGADKGSSCSDSK